MLRIDKVNRGLIALPQTKMQAAGYWERRDIQEMICGSPGAFCDELGELIWIVGQEISPTEFVKDRIDLLGIDPDGNSVVIELKRDSHKLHLLQALSYAGMIADWEPKRFIEELQEFNKTYGKTGEQKKQSFDDAWEELQTNCLTDGEIETVNRNQRIVLIAEDFDYEVLVTAEWLTKRGVDIRCYRIRLATNGQDEFFTCSCVYPPPELTEIAVRRRRSREIGDVAAPDWDGVISRIKSEAVRKFFQDESKNHKRSIKSRALVLNLGGRRRFVVYAKQEWARVWQNGRFDGDSDFWSARLSDAKVETIGNGKALRFYLVTETDFARFLSAIKHELAAVEFRKADDKELDDDELSASDEHP